jgi:Fe-S oxidoreductase
MSAYSMGQVFRIAPIAERFPEIVNLVTQTPGLSSLANAAAGLTQKRKIPGFPRQSFRPWFQQHSEEKTRPNDTRPSVILWADTFNNYFFPHAAQAAVEVLESAGYRVLVPDKNLCCGRPLYDYGFLQAKHNLEEILDALRPQITAGTPMVVLEPSCASVFPDELNSLLPNDEDAKRLRQQTFLLSEFLNRIDYQPPPMASVAGSRSCKPRHAMRCIWQK